ncbi:prepilin peptidase [Kitasatospora viridis]|uniref:Leader peptidase (Prepilin peptidase)/N-methyltransferase n=1 Tax=Kitasatospora viridis TaxID=281105 RepID=A0A561SAL0_9ACTN|nr:A24 family peptidase [Kitasatospora viridis]TWF71844.1 leader peptidase (prepilin peptidase)/N-methyltransferase [Kitasatospora viridis]
MPPTLVLIIGLLGLAVGSFLNVAASRVPAGRSVVRPRSACPRCAAPIAARDNIPVLSWFLLGRRCRSCRLPIPARYPLLEALTAILFAAEALRFGRSETLPAELVFTAGLLALATCDAEHLLLPRRLIYPTLGLTAACLLAAATATGQWQRLGTTAVCGAGAFAAFFALHWVRPAWLGFGDVRLAGLLGTGLGWLGPWYLVLALVAGSAVGLLVGVALMASGRATRHTRLPFGLFLAAGAIAALLVGAPVVHWYESLSDPYATGAPLTAVRHGS